jgi:XisI protein
MDTQTSLTHPEDPLDQWMSDRRYRNIILDVLGEIVDRFQNTPQPTIRSVPVFDEAHNQYQILDIGWDGSGDRIFQPIIHVELLNGKIWIQENATDIDLAKEFLEWGADASDIVLGMHSPSLRRFSEYAIE